MSRPERPPRTQMGAGPAQAPTRPGPALPTPSKAYGRSPAWPRSTRGAAPGCVIGGAANVPSPSCTRCGGTGWVWQHAPAPGGAVRVVEASCPACCGPTAAEVLDWREVHHWSPQARPCRHCAHPTHLRDDGQPAHKVCASAAAEAACAETSAADEIAGGAA